MKDKWMIILINFIGAIVVFASFSFDEFLNWIIAGGDNYHYILLPW